MNTDGGLGLNNLENIIKRTIELKMIPMVRMHFCVIIYFYLDFALIYKIELHDATGSSDASRLLECAFWFKNNIDLFNRYKRYILINIANEWV